MATIVNTVTDDKKDACAIRLMRTMLIKYSELHSISFDEAMLSFTASSAYEILFDYDTAVWKEGPDYLMMLFEEALDRDKQSE